MPKNTSKHFKFFEKSTHPQILKCYLLKSKHGFTNGNAYFSVAHDNLGILN